MADDAATGNRHDGEPGQAGKKTPADITPPDAPAPATPSPGRPPAPDGTAPSKPPADPAAPAATPSAAKPSAAKPSAAKPSAKAAPAAPAPAPEPTGIHAEIRDLVGEDYNEHHVTEDGVPVSVVAPQGLFAAARHVRATGHRILSLLSAYDGGDHFGVLYAFVKPASSPEEFSEVRLRTRMPKKDGEQDIDPEAPSLCDLYPGANWQEREMYDMYGIRFVGHPDLRRMFLPEGWTGYPMRKDYKEPEQYVGMEEGEDIVLAEQEEGSW